MSCSVLEETYREGPYKRPVLGSPETIRALTRDQMADYHAHHSWRPGNLVAVVVGDVESDRAVDEVKGCLGSISGSSGAVTDPAPLSADYAWGLHREYPRDTNEAYLMMTFPAPGIADTSNRVPYALELAATILGGSRSSRLWQSIREEQQIVSSIALNYLTLRGDSLIEVFATLEPRNLQSAIDAVWTVLGDFLREGPTAEELQRAKTSITNQYLFDNESNETNRIFFFNEEEKDHACQREEDQKG